MQSQPVNTRYIAIDPAYCGGKPRISGTRMPVVSIAEMYLEMGESLETIAQKYNLSLADFLMNVNVFFANFWFIGVIFQN